MFIGLRIALTVALSVGTLLAIFRSQVLSIFTDDPAVIALGSTILIIGLILEPGRTSNLVIISALRAAGDAKFPVVIGISVMWGKIGRASCRERVNLRRCESA